MYVLILGGTRFLGQRVAESMRSAGHNVTTLSRRAGNQFANSTHICAERNAGLKGLFGKRFDLVLDFICYNKNDVLQVGRNILTKRYVLISSTWLPRLWSGRRADELVSCPTAIKGNLPTVTLRYLIGKLGAEHSLESLRTSGCSAVSLRLPIMLGKGDHTDRLNFYLRRLGDAGPVIAVDGGHNNAQIAAIEDSADAIVRWSTEIDINRFRVWEAIPDTGQSVRAIIQAMAAAARVNVHLVDVPAMELADCLPEFLEKEPFWRESALPISSANIFEAAGISPSSFAQKCSIPLREHCETDVLREQELSFLADRLAR